MQVSHSRVETFKKCQFLYKLKYIDGLKTLKYVDEANNALLIGTGVHTGIEKSVKDGIKEYYNCYPIITDLHVHEAMKFEHLVPKVKELISGWNITFEYKIDTELFMGYIDALVDLGDNQYAVYDFKYSNNVDHYKESPQLHLYKYFFEQMNPTKRVVKLGFIFVPKTMIRQKKTEDLYQFRKRLIETLESLEVTKLEIDYDESKVNQFLEDVKSIEAATEFPKNESRLCDFCEFNLYCKQGVDYMILPKNEKRTVCAAERKKIWIYGLPFSGKTSLANQFPNAIMLNTDGNLNSFDSPYISIAESFEGRIKVQPWETFTKAIDELQKGGHTFETIVVDLIEDAYEHCRTYGCSKLGIDHESDNSFKAYDFIRKEFLDCIKRLTTLPYNIVLISHEDLSRDITRKSGDKITAIRPNIAEKVANKLAGMVDVVARVVSSGGERTLNFKSDDVVFGGGRLQLDVDSIPCTYEALDKLYRAQCAPKHDEVQDSTPAAPEEPKPAPEEPAPKLEPAPAKKVLTNSLGDLPLTDSESEEPVLAPAQEPERRVRRRRVS